MRALCLTSLLFLCFSGLVAQEYSYACYSESTARRIIRKLKKLSIPNYTVKSNDEGHTLLRFSVVKIKYKNGRVATGAWRLSLVPEDGGGTRIVGYYDERDIASRDDGSIAILPYESFEAFIDALK